MRADGQRPPDAEKQPNVLRPDDTGAEAFPYPEGGRSAEAQGVLQPENTGSMPQNEKTPPKYAARSFAQPRNAGASPKTAPDAPDPERDARMMRLALREADAAFALGEVPIGAVVARGDEVIAAAHNERETGRDATLHAECTAIRRACERLGGWRLPGCTLYVTLEPCPMCAGAAINARIGRVVYGAPDPKAGSVDSLVRLFDLPYNHLPALTGGVLEDECAARMTAFFEKLRAKRSVRRMKKIDMHAHIPPHPAAVRPNGTRFPTPDELRAMYDELGVDRGVAMALDSPLWSYDPITNFDNERVCRERPETAGWWFCTVDPRVLPSISEEQLGDYLAQYKARGARGIGELVAELPFDDPRCFVLFWQAERLGLPVTFHIGLTDAEYGLRDDPGLPRLERALQAFPGLTFVGHSQRFWSEISGDVTDAQRGGYPAGPVAPGGRVPELLRRYPNLHADLSAGSGFNAVSRDPDFGFAFLEEFQSQLHFACDICSADSQSAPFFGFSKYLDDAALQNRISDRTYRAVCRDNSLRLLGGQPAGAHAAE